jgi:hypothetical protein
MQPTCSCSGGTSSRPSMTKAPPAPLKPLTPYPASTSLASCLDHNPPPSHPSLPTQFLTSLNSCASPGPCSSCLPALCALQGSCLLQPVSAPAGGQQAAGGIPHTAAQGAGRDATAAAAGEGGGGSGGGGGGGGGGHTATAGLEG